MKSPRLVCKTLLLLVLSSMSFVTGCATNPATGRSQLTLMSMSTAEEISIGKNMFPQILQKMGGAYPDPELQTYIQKVGDRLKYASHRTDITYTFKLVNDSTPNAFAMPGGYIAITRGLLANLQNEAQLAAVIGHEIGHVDARHAVAGLQRNNLLGLGLAILSGATGGAQYGSLIRSSGEVVATMLDRSYSRGQEEESDRLGIDYMVKTGYDPNGAVELQQIFYQKIDKMENPQWLGGLFRTHPFSKKRLDGNRAYIDAKYGLVKGAGRMDNVSFADVTARLRDALPGYVLYDQAKIVEKNRSVEEAINLYLQAAASAPEEALILAELGIAYLKMEEFVSAKQHLLRAVKLDNNYYLSHLGLAYTYLNQGRANKTIAHADKSFKLLPTVEGVYLSARGYEDAGQIDKALERYHIVKKNDPKSKMGKHAAVRIVVLEGAK